MNRPIWDTLPPRAVTRREIAAVLDPRFARTIGRAVYAKVPTSGYRKEDYGGITVGDPDPDDPKVRLHEFAEDRDEPYEAFGVFDARVHLVALVNSTSEDGTYAWQGWRKVESWAVEPQNHDDLPGTWANVAVAVPAGYVSTHDHHENHAAETLDPDEAAEVREALLDERREATFVGDELPRDVATLFARPAEDLEPPSTHLVPVNDGRRPAPLATTLCGDAVADAHDDYERVSAGWPDVPTLLDHPSVCDACVRVVEDPTTLWHYGDRSFGEADGTPLPIDHKSFGAGSDPDDDVLDALAYMMKGADSAGKIPTFKVESGGRTFTDCVPTSFSWSGDPTRQTLDGKAEAVGLDEDDREVEFSFSVDVDYAAFVEYGKAPDDEGVGLVEALKKAGHTANLSLGSDETYELGEPWDLATAKLGDDRPTDSD